MGLPIWKTPGSDVPKETVRTEPTAAAIARSPIRRRTPQPASARRTVLPPPPEPPVVSTSHHAAAEELERRLQRDMAAYRDNERRLERRRRRLEAFMSNRNPSSRDMIRITDEALELGNETLAMANDRRRFRQARAAAVPTSPPPGQGSRTMIIENPDDSRWGPVRMGDITMDTVDAPVTSARGEPSRRPSGSRRSSRLSVPSLQRTTSSNALPTPRPRSMRRRPNPRNVVDARLDYYENIRGQSLASRASILNHIDGLGDRERSVEPEADVESHWLRPEWADSNSDARRDNWDTMRSTLRQDEHLPSIDSSFTSAAASASFTSRPQLLSNRSSTDDLTTRRSTGTPDTADSANNSLTSSRTSQTTHITIPDDNEDNATTVDSDNEYCETDDYTTASSHLDVVLDHLERTSGTGWMANRSIPLACQIASSTEVEVADYLDSRKVVAEAMDIAVPTMDDPDAHELVASERAEADREIDRVSRLVNRDYARLRRLSELLAEHPDIDRVREAMLSLAAKYRELTLLRCLDRQHRETDPRLVVAPMDMRREVLFPPLRAERSTPAPPTLLSAPISPTLPPFLEQYVTAREEEEVTSPVVGGESAQISGQGDEELEQMRGIVEALARRQDIPDEWWAGVGLSRVLRG